MRAAVVEDSAEVNEQVLHILQHSLGLDQYGRGRDYRNHFVTGPGCGNFTICQQLVADGMMHDHGAHVIYGGGHCFTVTAAGREYIRQHSPPPPKLSRSQKRYQEYLEEDCDMSFGQWLRKRNPHLLATER